MLLLLGGSATICAQTNRYLFKHITIDNGLINNNVLALCQDSNGFIWIGTQTGLQRYDGKRFVTYLADVHNPDALHADWITAIFEDSKKRLWIGTEQGAPYLLNGRNGKFYNFSLHDPVGQENINGIWQFLEDKDGHIWVAAHNGYYRLNDVSNRFESMSKLLQMGNRVSSSSMAKDTNGDLWFATGTGLKKLSFPENILTDKDHNPDHLALFDTDKPISFITFADTNNIWVSSGYDGVLYRYNFITKQLKNYSFGKKFHGVQKTNNYTAVGRAFFAAKGKLLAPLLSNGIAIYNYEADTFSVIAVDNTNPYGLHINPATFGQLSIMQDKENNIWIGSDAGINIMDLSKQPFVSYTRPSDATGLVSSAEVSDILQDKNGDIYASYYVENGGIVRFDKNLNFKKRYLVKERAKGAANQLWNLFQDNQGIIWAPAQAENIVQLNPVNDQLRVLNDSSLSGSINQIQQDADNNIWMGHWRKGLIKIDAITKEIIIYKDFDKAEANSLRRVLCFLFDNEKIWVGTVVNGLQLLDKKSGTFIASYRLDEKNQHSVSNNNITSIIAYNKDTLIVGTQGGINIFDKNKRIFSAITSKDGLPNNLVQALALDNDHNLWVALFGGLSKINMHTLVITNYDEDDGIVNNLFNNHFCKLNDGRLAIGSPVGFMVFDPAKVMEASEAPGVMITGFKVFDQFHLVDSLVNTDKQISLSYLDNSFHIEFASLQFNSSKSLKYFYQLTGVDKTWLQADETQSVNYNQLQPGHYIFQVKCRNRNGVFSNNVTTLSIHIIPPFWKRWWFGSLILLAIVIGLLVLIKWREYNFKEIETGKTRLQQLTAEKYKMQLEAEQISHFFTTSLFNKSDVDEVLWDVAGNLIGKLGFVDCMIYLWNDDRTKFIQKAGYGPKGSLEELEKNVFDVLPGQGVVGAVIETGNAILVPDTSRDYRYRADDIVRLSEICVPIKYNEQLLGAIDSEHHEKNFFTTQHLQALNTIATLVGSKIMSIKADHHLQQQKAELAEINQQLAEVQLAALRSQMNPHFIFNALNSIKKFVIANEPANAEKYLGKFSKLIRSILDNSQRGMVTVEKELQLLTLYLDLEQLRFGTKLTYTITADENIDTRETKIPSMIVQPFVENAMLHGIMHIEHPGKIDILFLQHEHWLEIVIEDNGIGRKKSASYKSDHAEPHHSIGIDVAKKRLEALKRDEDTPAGIEIVDLENERGEGRGTRVTISIPI